MVEVVSNGGEAEALAGLHIYGSSDVLFVGASAADCGIFQVNASTGALQICRP